jgi:hypothetical protein
MAGTRPAARPANDPKRLDDVAIDDDQAAIDAEPVIYGQLVDGSSVSDASVAIDDRAHRSLLRPRQAATKQRRPLIPMIVARRATPGEMAGLGGVRPVRS